MSAVQITNLERVFFSFSEAYVSAQDIIKLTFRFKLTQNYRLAVLKFISCSWKVVVVGIVSK